MLRCRLWLPSGGWYRLVLALKQIDVDDCLTVVCVRNPLPHIASLWSEKLKNYDGSLGKQKMFHRYQHLTPNLMFPAFVDWQLSTEGMDDWAGVHWRSQTSFLLAKNDHLAADHICRIETIEQDLKTVTDRVGAPIVDLARMKSNQGRVAHLGSERDDVQSLYQQRLTPTVKEKLTIRYEADLELLGDDLSCPP